MRVHNSKHLSVLAPTILFLQFLYLDAIMSASHRLCGRRQILVTVLFVALCPSLISSRLLGLSLPNDASPRLPTLPLRVAFEDKDLYSVAKPTTTEASDEMVRAFVVAKVEADEGK